MDSYSKAACVKMQDMLNTGLRKMPSIPIWGENLSANSMNILLDVTQAFAVMGHSYEKSLHRLGDVWGALRTLY